MLIHSWGRTADRGELRDPPVRRELLRILPPLHRLTIVRGFNRLKGWCALADHD